jgi:hypothetical protein
MNLIKAGFLSTEPSCRALIKLGMLEVFFVDAIILRSLGIGNNIAISYVGGGLLLPFDGL